MDAPHAVIVGGGAAGLVAALAAAWRGAWVVLVDRDGFRTSDLAAGGGLVSAAGTRFQRAAGIADSPARWAADIRAKVAALDPVILDIVTRRSAEAVGFLADEVGLDMHVMADIDIPGHSLPRLHATPARNGREFAALLAGAVCRHPGIEVLDDGEATGLILDGDAVAGIELRRGDAIRARWTLLASGGFGADRGMLRRFIPDAAEALHIGAPTSDGRAIRWAEALEADLLFMGGYQGHGHATADGKGRLIAGLTPFGALVVNRAGERFVNEDMGPSEFAAEVLRQPGGQAVEIYDGRIHERAMAFGSYREVFGRGAVLSADTPAALAAALDLPPAAFAATLAAFDRAARGEAADPFGRTGVAAPLAAPFHGVRIVGALAHTQGGVRVDAGACVLRPDGTPIAGLLAAGGVAASISGDDAAGYLPGNGLAQSFALGMAAAGTVCKL